ARCSNSSEVSLCWSCSSPRRDASVLCVVESAFDVLAIERTSEFSGLYFVLHGVISPIDGVGPDQIHVPQLLERVREEGMSEVIIATNADIEGEATAVYLHRALSPPEWRWPGPPTALPRGAALKMSD